MTTPLTSDVVPSDFNQPHEKLEFLISLINAEIRDSLKRGGGLYDNKDGTFDRFRCVIYFEDDEGGNIATHVYWHYYHQYIMEAYRKAGWGVKKWLEGKTTFRQGHEYPVPCYCLYIPQIPIPEILDSLQDKIQQPC